MKLEDFDPGPSVVDRWDVAFETAQKAQLDLPPLYGCRLELGPRDYQLHRTLRLTRCMHIVGGGIGSTRLVFQTDAGIEVCKDEVVAGQRVNGEDSIIEGVALMGAGLGGSAHGVLSWRRFTMRDCSIYNFGGNAIHIHGSADTPGSGANGWRIDNVNIRLCGGHGLHTQGGDCNGGLATSLVVTSCKGWGIHERGFLGNAYVGCLVDSCQTGEIKAGGNANASAFIGCYAEAGVPTDISYPSMIVGRGIENFPTAGAPSFISSNGAIGQLLCDADGVMVGVGGDPRVALKLSPKGAGGISIAAKTWRLKFSADGSELAWTLANSDPAARAVLSAEGFWTPRARLIGYTAATRVREIAWSGPPTFAPDGDGVWHCGDRVLNTRPDLVRVAGWVYDGTTWSPYGGLQ